MSKWFLGSYLKPQGHKLDGYQMALNLESAVPFLEHDVQLGLKTPTFAWYTVNIYQKYKHFPFQKTFFSLSICQDLTFTTSLHLEKVEKQK